MEFLKYFWDVVVDLDPEAISLHEMNRFSEINTNWLKFLFDRSGIVDTIITPIEINTHFRDFDDFWKPFLGGQGPAATYVLSLEKFERDVLRDSLYDRLPVLGDGSIKLAARAWAAKGRV
jgi:hypothetical protein